MPSFCLSEHLCLVNQNSIKRNVAEKDFVFGKSLRRSCIFSNMIQCQYCVLRYHSILSNRPKSNLEAPPSISFKFRFGIDLSLLNKLSKDHINFSRLTTKTLINAHFRQLHMLNAIPKISKLPATNLNSRSSELITMILFENAFHMGLCLRGKL